MTLKINDGGSFFNWKRIKAVALRLAFVTIVTACLVYACTGFDPDPVHVRLEVTNGRIQD